MIELPKPGDMYHGRQVISVSDYKGRHPELYSCTVLMTSSCTTSGTIEMAWSRDHRLIKDGI